MLPNQKIKFKDWYMKIDPPMWIAADFECMNIPIIDNDNDHVTDKLFINKPVAIGYNIVKNPEYENLSWEKDGYIKNFGKDCVEWFINEMLEIESYVNTYFKNELEINLDTLPENYDQTRIIKTEFEQRSHSKFEHFQKARFHLQRTKQIVFNLIEAPHV